MNLLYLLGRPTGVIFNGWRAILRQVGTRGREPEGWWGLPHQLLLSKNVFVWYDLANLEDSLLDCHSLNISLLNLPLPNNRDMWDKKLWQPGRRNLLLPPSPPLCFQVCSLSRAGKFLPLILSDVRGKGATPSHKEIGNIENGQRFGKSLPDPMLPSAKVAQRRNRVWNPTPEVFVTTWLRLTISPEQDLPQDSTLPVEPGPSYHLVAKIYVCQLFGVIAKYLQILIEYLKVHTLKKENSETRFKCKSYVPRFKKDHILLCSWEGVVKIIYPNFKNNIEFFVCFVFRQVQFEQKD